MSWRETSPVDERREFVVLAGQKTASVSALCREFGISRKTAHKWLRIARSEGLGPALEDRSRRPHRVQRISEAIEQRVVEVRKQTGYGGRNISDQLAREGMRVAPATVDRVIVRQGLGAAEASGHTAWRRFEREAPNQLWQMDFKAEYRLAAGRCVALSVLDDHSRFAVGLFALRSIKAEETQRSLRTCFESYGVPEAMLMDHGSPWWSTTNAHGLTRVSVELIEQGVRLYYGGIRHPQTQGKVERFHRTMDRALRYRGVPLTVEGVQAELERFRSDYNEQRPHTALDRQVPASRYVRSPRAYQPVPPAWEYPEGAEVRRLNSLGVLDLPGQRFFVCEALAGKDVWCRRVDERILVTYRHMYVREIDLRRGRTTAVVRPSEPNKPVTHVVRSNCNP